MSSRFHRITPFLWFSTQAEEAAAYYTGIFPNSRIVDVVRYTDEVAKASGQPVGSAMTVAFELDNQPLTALNGGPVFTFNEAVSLVVHCQDAKEVDYYWDKLTAGGPVEAQQCGWLKDRYGLSWQVVPEELIELFKDPDPAKVARIGAAVMQMKKLDVAQLRKAAAG
jgi:predicted 3-demethylubiquinone-9 3-methyltransferase (glyoxalase superfamily)